ncbi:hypothetical protein EC973_006514, partial [Apophysomyces ossiformis]
LNTPRTPSLYSEDGTSSSQSRPKGSITTPYTPSLDREYSLQSLHGKDEYPWTRSNWERLETYYDKMNRNIDDATDMFYRFESIKHGSADGDGRTTELWPKEKIRWLCQCLDTNTRYHKGLLPSQRKRNKKKRHEPQLDPVQPYQVPKHRSVAGSGDPKHKIKRTASSSSSSSSRKEAAIKS